MTLGSVIASTLTHLLCWVSLTEKQNKTKLEFLWCHFQKITLHICSMPLLVPLLWVTGNNRMEPDCWTDSKWADITTRLFDEWDCFWEAKTSTGKLALGIHKIPPVTKADGWTAVLCHFYRLTTCHRFNKFAGVTGSSLLTATATACETLAWSEPLHDSLLSLNTFS